MIVRRAIFNPAPGPIGTGPIERTMSTSGKVTGPASYFPSIEKTYGQPIDHWMQVLGRAGPLKHTALVGLLKSEHGLGHGHANALVAAFLARGHRA